MSVIQPLREYPTFGRVATWNEWQDATVKSMPDYMIPWFISNMVGFAILWIAIPYPVLGRRLWGFLLVVASAVNTYQMLTNPNGYLEFGVLAIPPLQTFIYSTFFSSPSHFVLPIALCQLIIGIILMYTQKAWLLKISLTGAILFFLGISFLGMGSAFPSGLVYASTMMICWPMRMKYKHD